MAKLNTFCQLELPGRREGSLPRTGEWVNKLIVIIGEDRPYPK